MSGRQKEPRNVADAEALRVQGKKLSERQAIIESELRELLALSSFRRYVWRWMDQLKMWGDAIPLNSELYIQSAERRVALRIWREIQDVNPDALLEMMRSAKNQEL